MLKFRTNLQSYGWVIVAAFILLQPFKNWFELPIAIMALLGLLRLIQHPREVMMAPAFKPLLLMFSCIFLPMLFSLTDAVNLNRSAMTTLVFLRFPLMAIFVIDALKSTEARRNFLMVLGAVLCFAALDLIFQAIFGYNILGLQAMVPGRLSGLMPHRLAIGHLLAVLATVYFYWVWQLTWQRRWLWALAPIYVAAIVVAGARVAWVMLVIGVVLIAFQLWWVERVKWRWRIALGVIFLWIFAIGGALQYSGINQRLQATTGVFSGDYEETNAATSLRLPIWKVATKVVKDHWINGVGPRGFRYIYFQYADKDDYWKNAPYKDKAGNLIISKFGPTHPHQLFLEIFAETGMIGVIAYLYSLVYWIRLWLAAARSQLIKALPWMAAVLIAIMPINAHMAFYASFWSCITWWLIAVSLAHWQAERGS